MFSFFKKKENIHVMNFRAQFANFRKKYAKDLNAVGIDQYGKAYGKLVDEVEANVIKIVSDPKTQIAENINYWNTTVDQVLAALINKVECGQYVYRGMPAYETAYFAKMYRKLAEDLYNEGIINADERTICLNNLSMVIKENG